VKRTNVPRRLKVSQRRLGRGALVSSAAIAVFPMPPVWVA
jgi:hypothetical protein